MAVEQPILRTMDIAGTHEALRQVAERVEAEERMVAGATEAPVVSRGLLTAVGRALGAVHVQGDGLRRVATMDPVDPHPSRRETAQCRQVLIRRQPLRFEASI